jgi:hypothetical protein
MPASAWARGIQYDKIEINTDHVAPNDTTGGDG